MNKEIYFCVDLYSKATMEIPHKDCRAESYNLTDKYIKEGRTPIITLSVAHLSFDLITLGYDIYLCYKDKKVKIEPHMDLSGIGEPCKDLRFGHNIFKLFRAGVFNQLLGIGEGVKDEV